MAEPCVFQWGETGFDPYIYLDLNKDLKGSFFKFSDSEQIF